jgi:hypothetical protein
MVASEMRVELGGAGYSVAWCSAVLRILAAKVSAVALGDQPSRRDRHMLQISCRRCSCKFLMV